MVSIPGAVSLRWVNTFSNSDRVNSRSVSVTSRIAALIIFILSWIRIFSVSIVFSGRLSKDDRCMKVAHIRSASSLGLGWVETICGRPVTDLLLLHTSVVLGLLLHCVIHVFQELFLTWVHSSAYAVYASWTCFNASGVFNRLKAFSLVL